MKRILAGWRAELGTETLLEEPRRHAARSRRRPLLSPVAVSAIAALLLLVSTGMALSAQTGSSAWTAPRSIDHVYPFGSPFAITSMSCTSTTLCVGNTNLGDELVTSTNPSGSSPSDWAVLSTSLIAQDGTGYSLAGTSCVTTGTGPFCTASGTNTKLGSNTGGVFLTSTNPTGGASAWKPAAGFPSYPSSPSCGQTGSTTTCIVTAYAQALNRQVAYVSTKPGGGSASWTRVALTSLQLPGGPSSAVCPSSTLCAALDGNGNFSSSTTPTTASSWSHAGHSGLANVASLSCPSTTFCLAGGYSASFAPEIATTANPGAGASATWHVQAEGALNPSITCSPDGSLAAPHAICFAAHSNGSGLEVSTNGGATWSSETLAAGTGALDGYGSPDVSCPAHTLCAAGDQFGGTVHSANAYAGVSAVWSAPVPGVAGGISPVDISPGSCTTTLCIGADGAGRILTSTNPASTSSWVLRMDDPGHAINAVLCPASTLCVAVDGAGNVLDSTTPSQGGATWTHPASIAGVALYNLACPSSSLCVATGSNNAVISTNPAGGASTWSKQLLSTSPDQLQCPSTTLCVGFDSAGKLVMSTNPTAGSHATWTVSASLDSSYVNNLQCPSASLCVAIDNNGNVLVSTKPSTGAASWSKPAPIDPVSNSITGLSCPSAALCFAWDYTGHLLTSTNPAKGAAGWTVPQTLDSGSVLTHVECATATACVAIDNSGHVLTTNNPAGGARAWSAPLALEAGVPLHRLACPSATLCVIMDSGGNVITGP